MRFLLLVSLSLLKSLVQAVTYCHHERAELQVSFHFGRFAVIRRLFHFGIKEDVKVVPAIGMKFNFAGYDFKILPLHSVIINERTKRVDFSVKACETPMAVCSTNINRNLLLLRLSINDDYVRVVEFKGESATSHLKRVKVFNDTLQIINDEDEIQRPLVLLGGPQLLDGLTQTELTTNCSLLLKQYQSIHRKLGLLEGVSCKYINKDTKKVVSDFMFEESWKFSPNILDRAKLSFYEPSESELELLFDNRLPIRFRFVQGRWPQLTKNVIGFDCFKQI